MKPNLCAAAIFFSMAACSPEPSEAPPAASNEAAPNPRTSTPPPAGPRSPPSEAAPAANVLTLEGLGALRVGQPVPTDSGWAERGAQISDSCRLVSSSDFPGVYAIAEGGRVRRITLGQRSRIRLVEGVGVGSSEAEVRAAFAGFHEEPHKYVEAPAKYLTAPNAPSGDAALRFEIGADGRVSLIHVGTMPVLGYVEGCA